MDQDPNGPGNATPEDEATAYERVPRNDPPPVVWTPEDAANFLRTAIKESQQPLKDAMQQQGIPRTTFALLALLVLTCGVGVWRYLHQEITDLKQRRSLVEMAWRRAELDASRAMEARAVFGNEAKNLRSSMFDFRQRNQELKMEAKGLRKRQLEYHASMVNDQADARVLRESIELKEKMYRKRIAALEKQLKAHGKGFLAARNELERRRQNDGKAEARLKMLTAQLAGQEEEKQALRKQIAAARAFLLSGTDTEKTVPPANSVRTPSPPSSPPEKAEVPAEEEKEDVDEEESTQEDPLPQKTAPLPPLHL